MKINDVEQSILWKFKSGLRMHTPSVGDLKVFLAQLPDDMPVVFTWEGLHRGIDYTAIEKDKPDKEVIDVLVISVE